MMKGFKNSKMLNEIKMKKTTKDIFGELKVLFTIKGINLDKVFISGGSLLLNAPTPNDVDLYVTEESVIKEICEVLCLIGEEKSETINAITFESDKFSCPIQVIKILIGDPEEVTDRFDFEQNGNYLLFSKTFNQIKVKNETTNLKLCKNVETPMNLTYRLQVMLLKGYTINKKELENLLSQVKKSIKELPDDWNLGKKDLGSFYDL